MALEERLRDLADEYAPPEHREGFVFHAMELWSGGKILKRGEYPQERRWEALKRLCALPSEFGIPVVKGQVHKETYCRIVNEQLSGKELTDEAQIAAFTECLTVVEHFMRNEAGAAEVAKIAVEHNSQNYQIFKEQHRSLKSPECLEGMNPAARPLWPLKKIVDGVEACEKADTSLLQIADACAFIIRKVLENHPEAEQYFEGFRAQLNGYAPFIHRDCV